MDQRLDGNGAQVKSQKPRVLSWTIWLWIPLAIFLIVFYFYPLFSILGLSLDRASGHALSPFLEAFQSPSIRKVIGFTFFQAILSTLLTLLFGLPIAYLVSHYQFRGKALIQALVGVPFVMPTLVVAAGFNALLGPHGWINQGLMTWFGLDAPPIHFTNTLAAILVAHVFYNTTIVLRIVGDYWSHLDPRLGQAALVLGANRWQALRQVTMPLLMPVIMTSALLVFLFDFTSFAVILILGGPRFATMEVEIYNQTVGLFNLPLAAVLAIMQLVFTLVITILYTHLANRTALPLNLRSRQVTQRPLLGWRSRLIASVVIGGLLLVMTAPLIALAARSISRFDYQRGQRNSYFNGFTLDYYRELNINRRETLFYASPATSIAISLGYASATVLLALGLGLPAAWALARDRTSWLNRIFDPIIMLPIGTSAVTLGLGFIVALDQPPLNLRATPWLVPLAHTLVAFPFVVRSLTPALRSIRPRLHQAAAVLGATPWQVLKNVDLPIAGRALLIGATFAFTISLGEFGATSMIARPEYPTVPVAIYRLLGQPGALFYGQAMALSTILMIVTASGMLAIERFRIGEVGEF
jgi:thiamine transport system permease protein